MSMIREKIPQTIVTIVLILMISEFFISLPDTILEINKDLRNFGAIVAAFALILGSANIIRVYGGRIYKRTPGWQYSVLLLIALVAMTITGLGFGENSAEFLWLYNYIQVPIGATIFSLLGFFIVSAAYRAFRARTWEATVLLITGIIIILWGAPIGHVIWPGIDPIASWIMDVPNDGGWKSFIITISIGQLGIGIMLLTQRLSAFSRMKAAAEGGAE